MPTPVALRFAALPQALLLLPYALLHLPHALLLLPYALLHFPKLYFCCLTLCFSYAPLPARSASPG
ncbi:hypothetical protein C2E15_02935 [Mixta gaviniae]|uniref:Uncharacterized protein n=1 Tax=Mixta gaviniae TaxID=665914 RepID=A0A2L0IC28_9GAMM|nr:hypothetical protein C2E15_02935 [Mixta gaviniae]